MKVTHFVVFLWTYFSALAAQRMAPRDLDRLRSRRRKHFFRSVLTRSPYYRRVVLEPRGTEPRAFEKAELLDHFDEWNIFGFSEADVLQWGNQGEQDRDFSQMRGGISVGLSSGTSGRRGIFLTTALERVRWAAVVLARFLPGFWKQRHRVALFLRANSPLYETLGGARIQFQYFDILRPLDELFHEVKTFSPTVLFAPPSVLLGLVAKAEHAGTKLTPGLLIVGAETLDPAARRRLEGYFSCPVREIYQATEGFLAFTCPQGKLHWNEDFLLIEKQVLPPDPTDDRVVRYFPIITDWVRTSQPIFRYRLNDIVTDDPSGCSCGCSFRVIGRIEGREDDVLCLPSRHHDSWVPVFPDFVRRAIVEALPDVTDYRVLQASPQTLEIQIDHRGWGALEPKLLELWVLVGALPPHVVVVPYREPASGKKLRRVERSFSLPEGFWSPHH